MRGVVEVLRGLGYDEPGCAARLGVDPLLGIRFFGAEQGRFGPMVAGAARQLDPGRRDALQWSSSEDPVDVLIGLFVAGEGVAIERLEGIFAPPALDALQQMRLVELDDDRARSRLQLYPVGQRYLVTDQPQPVPRSRPVMPLLPESYLLVHFVDRDRHNRRALDLGSGCGVHALAAAGHSDEVLGVDINPRAVRFAEFNATLNGQPANVRFACGDLYEPCGAHERYDLIVSNPPYVPCADREADASWFSGGPTGEEVLQRIVSGLPDRLADRGIAHLYTMVVHHDDVPYRDKLERWMGGLRGWDVAIRAVPFPFLSPNGPVAGASRFEIGLISLCRNDSGHAPRYQHGPRGWPFFGHAGQPRGDSPPRQ